MIPVTSCKGQTLALFGLGGSGLVTAAALIAGGARVVAWDDNPASVEKARAQGVKTADLRKADWSGFAGLVLAPGVPLTHPQPHWTVDMAHRHGVAIIGDVELFFRQMDAAGRSAPVVAITGTNGKSTTTALIAHVLASAGRDVQMGGNIGRAVLDLDPVSNEPANQAYVVECSSYQIDLTPSIKPHVGLLLNLTPDHLERHGSMDNYSAIKERLVAASDLAIVGMDDDYCLEIIDHLTAAKTLLTTISSHSGSAVDVGFANGALVSPSKEELVRLEGIGSLRGAHNGQNAAAAYAACEALGLSVGEIEAGFRSFPGLAHRMEQVGHARGVLFINDSKATNAEAALPALSSFEKVRWIAGGLAKEGGIAALQGQFHRIEKAYLIGEASGTYAAQLGDGVAYEISGTLDHAVANAARDAAGQDEVVLLSPAAASFDQFPNFEKRGDAFREAVRALPGFKPMEGEPT
ncbi:MAG: UDP-N-acetylmuramoyl-L-alanine--D-glutamate ligase [Pseudomonadota bacterium]